MKHLEPERARKYIWLAISILVLIQQIIRLAGLLLNYRLRCAHG